MADKQTESRGRDKPTTTAPAPPEPEVPPVTAAKPARTGLPIWAIGALAVGALLVIGRALRDAFAQPAPLLLPTADTAAIQLAVDGVAANGDWTPVMREFDGVPMALVPAGCFMMGSESGDSDELPVHEQCFDEPFWIDVYEVTNGQYGSSGHWSGDDLPRESVDWFEAVGHCENRGARLPTEAEWEYAARGPDGLVYPWGNDFVPDNVVYYGNSGGRTAEVGSRTGGVSWVGAHDMSGGVWEWVSSIYEPYPYDASDGREVDGNNDSGSARVLRGGSWFIYERLSLRAAFRFRYNPGPGYNSFGFRCALSY